MKNSFGRNGKSILCTTREVKQNARENQYKERTSEWSCKWNESGESKADEFEFQIDDIKWYFRETERRDVLESAEKYAICGAPFSGLSELGDVASTQMFWSILRTP